MDKMDYYLTNNWFKIRRSKEKQIKQINQALAGEQRFILNIYKLL